MKKKFEIGQKVGTFFDESEEFTSKARYDEDGCSGPFYGQVTEVLSDGDVRVLFDEEYLNEAVHDTKTGQLKERKPALVSSSHLLSEEDAKSKATKLEEEFGKVASEIKDKLKDAAKSIREANKLAKKLGTNLYNMGAGYDHLYSAMDSAGWQTSSFGC